jgi:hypothetical protein
MGIFRALNLLQGVENQTTLGAALQSKLVESPAQEAEFGAMLSTRHMARRMAGNAITMAAINSSNKAIEIVFENTSEYNSEPVKEVAKNSGAMLSTSTTLASLNAVTENSTAFEFFSASAFYDTYIFNTLATLISDLPSNHSSLSAFILDATARNAISINNNAVKALAYSSDALDIVVGANTAMVLELQNTSNAIDIIANSDLAVTKLAGSLTSLGALTTPTKLQVAAVPSALKILGANETGWHYLMSVSTTLDQTIYNMLIAFGGLNPAQFGTVESIFADATASAAVANSHPAMESIIAEADKTRFHILNGQSVMDKIIASNNLGTVLSSSNAMSFITANEGIMNTLIANTTAFPILLTSTAAKATIFGSTALVTTMMTAGSDSLATLQGLKITKVVGNVIPIGTFTSLGVAGNMILLTGVVGSIVATGVNHSFKGDTQPTYTTFIPGTSLTSGPVTINLPYTNAQWDMAAIGVTVAEALTITYVDFN